MPIEATGKYPNEQKFPSNYQGLLFWWLFVWEWCCYMSGLTMMILGLSKDIARYGIWTINF